MKKVPIGILIIWILLFCFALGFVVIGATTAFPDIVSYITAGVLFVANIVWIALFLKPLSKKQNTPKEPVGSFVNQTYFKRFSKETDDAVDRYLDAVERKGILKKSALYERPWFLLCGASKSGKSALLQGSGLNFPLRFPSEKDGLIVENSDQVKWSFANEAVWIDTPGVFMNDNSSDLWQAFIASLKKVRPLNPIDGLALVVNTKEVLNTDDAGIKSIAQGLRNRIDELISQWGIEFPVYLIFNRADEVPGFSDYFNDQLIRGQDQLFGATIGGKTADALPRIAFLEEFNILCKSLTDFRLDKLYKENDSSRKRMICRFVIHFESIQQKLGALVAELFKPSNYEGRPIFRGFYFTSCIEQKKQNAPLVNQNIDTPNMSQTIANHPLNPNRILSAKNTVVPGSSAASPSQTGQKSIVQSVFVLPLFREIMVKDKSLVKTTQKRSRQELLRYYAIVSGIVLVMLGVCGYLYNGYSKSTKVIQNVQDRIAILPKENASLMEQYAGLEMLRTTLLPLQKYDKRVPLSFGIGFYKGEKVYDQVKQLYFKRLQRFVIVPSVKYLEYRLINGVNTYGELAGEDYDNLYRILKAYLSISEAAYNHPQDLDTTFLRNMLFESSKQSILATINNSRLPANLETILQDNIGTFLVFLSKKDFPKIQENQRMVADARNRLRRLPGAATLYEAVCGKLIPQVPQIGINQILNIQGEGLLRTTQTISGVYTQQGWDQYMSDAITEAAKNPFKIDWVIGLTKNDVPEEMLDWKQLRQEMIATYTQDVLDQWLRFLSSVEIEPFGDMPRSARMIQKLTGPSSELALLLEAIATYATIKNVSELEKVGDAALNTASKLKATKAFAKQADKTMDKVESTGFSFGKGTPFDQLSASIDPLRFFARSQGGGMGGFEGYKDKLQTLAEKLSSLEGQPDAQVFAVFSGKDDDPLQNAYKFTENTLEGMPEHINAPLRKLLLRPLEYTGSAVSSSLQKSLNAQWQSEIVKVYTNRFSGRYPFSLRGEDASFNDVMDFFRPTTGTFWGFYDRVLSSYIIKNQDTWTQRKLGGISLTFDPKIYKSLSSAQRIRDIFFKNDGTLRTLDISFTPGQSNKNKAIIDLKGQVVELLPGGRTVRLAWPQQQGSSGAVLKIFVSNEFSQDQTFNGQWGLMKMLQASKVNKVNASVINAKWQINVQNMYTVFLDAKVQVSGADHPFADQIFQQFDCPTNLVMK